LRLITAILALVLIPSIVFADIGSIKIKVKQKNEHVHVKVIIKNPMHGQIEENKRTYWGNEKREINFITNITVKSNNNTLLHIETSPFMPENPVFRFIIKKDFFGNEIIVSIKDNNNNTKDKFIKIKNRSNNNTKIAPMQNLLLSRVNHPKIWKATTPEEAIKEMYGDVEMIEDVIQLKVPKISEGSFSVPIMIKTDIDLESIVILATNNPRSVISVIHIPTKGLRQLNTKIKFLSSIYIYKDKTAYDGYSFSREPTITIVGKGRNGKLYKTSKQTEFVSCINSGGGINNLDELYKVQMQD